MGLDRNAYSSSHRKGLRKVQNYQTLLLKLEQSHLELLMLMETFQTKHLTTRRRVL